MNDHHPKILELAARYACEPFDLLATHLEGPLSLGLCSNLDCPGQVLEPPEDLPRAICPDCGRRSIQPLDRLHLP